MRLSSLCLLTIPLKISSLPFFKLIHAFSSPQSPFTTPPPLSPILLFFFFRFLLPRTCKHRVGGGGGGGRKWRSKRCKICDSFLVCHPSRKKPRRFSCEYIKVCGAKKARQTADFNHFLTVLWDNLLFAFQICTFCPNFSD